MLDWQQVYKVSLPNMENADWKVERFEAKPDALAALREARYGRHYVPGVYTRLSHKHGNGHLALVMTDTPDEIADHLGAIERATGRCLINGLGMGMVLRAVLLKPEVTHVDVVEISQSLIDLVGPHYQDPRVHIQCADAFTVQWPKGAQWDIAWHDIWNDICSDNLAEMAKLHHKYARRVVWQGSWSKVMCLRQRRSGW